MPIGVAATRREGSDVTLLTYGAMVAPSLEAAERLAKEGVEVEVIDLRTLMPFDKEAIFASVEKTSRALIVHEDVKTLGIGAELSAVIMEERFDHLDAPVLRVTYPDTHSPFSHVLEAANLPNAEKITEALRKLAAVTEAAKDAERRGNLRALRPLYLCVLVRVLISSGIVQQYTVRRSRRSSSPVPTDPSCRTRATRCGCPASAPPSASASA